MACTVGGGCVALLLLGVSLTIGRWPTIPSNPFLSTVGYTLIAGAGGALLLLTLDEEFPFTKWLRHPWIAGLGTISYGFYVLHNLPLPVVTLVVSRLGLGMRTVFILFFFFAVAGLSLASFLLFESRFLRLKSILAPRPRRAPRSPEQPGI